MANVMEVVGSGATLNADGNATINRNFTVTGVTQDKDAVEAVNTYLLQVLGNPPNIGALVLDTINATEGGQNIYNVTSTWKTFQRRSQPQQPAQGQTQSDETDFSFSLSLQPVRLKIPIGAVAVFKATDAADWTPQMLNDVGSGEEPEGVDVFEPVYEEEKTIRIRTTALTQQYRTTLRKAVGKTNADEFQGWQPGEVLLMGVSGTRRGSVDSEITFRWSVRENEDNLTVAGISGIQKKGWQYLWPRAETRSSDTSPMVKTITHVCVATVFKETTFAQLNIG